MIKAIIFDWAGVLGTDGYWVWLKKNIENIEDRKGFFQEISEHVDSAKMPHSEFMEHLARESNKSPDQIWKEVKLEITINNDLVSLVKKLKAKYKIALLSNFTYPWLNEILTENNLWGLFDDHVISSEHKVIKPSPEIFEKILGMLNAKPEEAVFIDDQQMHLDGAKRVGLATILFLDNTQLIHDLRKLGIET